MWWQLYVFEEEEEDDDDEEESRGFSQKFERIDLGENILADHVQDQEEHQNSIMRDQMSPNSSDSSEEETD